MKTQGINQASEVKTLQKTTNKNLNNIPKTQEMKNDEVVLSSQKKEASTSKKVGVALASIIYPGLGQVCNGEASKGLKFFFGGIGINVLSTIAASAIFTANPALGILTACAGSFGHIALNVWSAVDAVTNAK